MVFTLVKLELFLEGFRDSWYGYAGLLIVDDQGTHLQT